MDAESLIRDFRCQKDEVINYVRKNGIESVSLFCSGYGIPIIAFWTYVSEEFPEYRERVQKSIDIVTRFYRYEKGEK
jgi:hypothetical protein